MCKECNNNFYALLLILQYCFNVFHKILFEYKLSGKNDHLKQNESV